MEGQEANLGWRSRIGRRREGQYETRPDQTVVEDGLEGNLETTDRPIPDQVGQVPKPRSWYIVPGNGEKGQCY